MSAFSIKLSWKRCRSSYRLLPRAVCRQAASCPNQQLFQAGSVAKQSPGLPHSLLCALLKELICSSVFDLVAEIELCPEIIKIYDKVDGSRFNKVLLLLGEECQEYIMFPNRANAAPTTVREKRIAP